MRLGALICVCFFYTQIFSQSGKDGTLTIGSGIVTLNKYFPVAGSITAGSNTIHLAYSSGTVLCPGDLILIYQAQGASINIINSSTYGSVTNYNSAGLYEFKYVKSVNGSQIIIQSPLSNSYSIVGRVQVVKVPQFSKLVINPGVTIQAKAWKDTAIANVLYRFGGLLVIHSDSIRNNGVLSATGKGFRGGQISNNTVFINGLVDFVSSNIFKGGEKGEGIFGYYQEYDANGGRYCRGAAANGGGGGTSTNASGGGGANGFNGNTWTGQGVMVVDNSNPQAAWALDPAYIANGNALTNSSGGGRGGYSWSDYNMNALTQGPGNVSWGGDNRREVGGIGGRALNNINAESRVYFGGGGGAGHQNNNGATSGGNGGGIIYLYAASGISGNGIIESSGTSVPTATGCSCDGLGGGGAGGTIVIKAGTLASTQTIIARGGKGGDQLANSLPASQPTEAQGPGGGGGGGFVALSSGLVVPDLVGGMNGFSQGTGVTEFPFNGATKGAAGQSGTVSTNFISFIPFSITAMNNSPICLQSVLSFSTSQLNVIYSWTGPGGFLASTQNPTILVNSQSMAGTYTLTVSYPGCGEFASATTSVSIDNMSLTLNVNSPLCSGQTLFLNATSNGNSFQWSGPSGFSAVSQSTTIMGVSLLNSGIYTVIASGNNSCSAQSTVNVSVFPSPVLSITGNSIICYGEATTLSANGASSYTWNTGQTINSILINPIQTTTYTVSGSIPPIGCTSTQSYTVKLYECTNIDEEGFSGSSVKLYPNPNGGNFSIRLSTLSEVTIIDFLGRSVYSTNMNAGTTLIELVNINPGVYFINIKSREKSDTFKVIIE